MFHQTSLLLYKSALASYTSLFVFRLKKEHRTKNGPRAECSETSQLKQVEGDVSYVSSKKEYEPSLVKAMVRVYGPYFAIAVVFKLINDSMLFVQPYLLRYVIVKEHTLYYNFNLT